MSFSQGRFSVFNLYFQVRILFNPSPNLGMIDSAPVFVVGCEKSAPLAGPKAYMAWTTSEYGTDGSAHAGLPAAEMGVRPPASITSDAEVLKERYFDHLTNHSPSQLLVAGSSNLGEKPWKSKLSSWEGLKSAIILVNINQQPYLLCTAPSPQKNNKTPQQLSAADADLFVSPAWELPTNQTHVLFFGVVNQHQPNQSSKKLAHKLGSWWRFTKTQHFHPPDLHPPFSTHLFPGRKRFKSWKLFKVVVAALPKSRKPNAWRRQQLRLWPGNGWGTGTGVGVGELERNGVGGSPCCVVFYSKISETSRITINTTTILSLFLDVVLCVDSCNFRAGIKTMGGLKSNLSWFQWKIIHPWSLRNNAAEEEITMSLGRKGGEVEEAEADTAEAMPPVPEEPSPPPEPKEPKEKEEKEEKTEAWYTDIIWYT